MAEKVGYTGHADDPESGLTYAQARYYDPVVGRFLSPDPVRMADDFSLYAYVGNDPINGVDPMGLCTQQAAATADTRSTEICQPAANLNASESGREVVRQEEGTQRTAYRDTGGLLTVGRGHLVREGDNVREGETISAEREEQLFAEDMATAVAGARQLVGDTQVSQEEFDALTDLVFNVGADRLSATNSPGLNEAVGQSNYTEIGNQIRYTRDAAGNRPGGLIHRNDRRQNIFRNGNYINPR